MQYAQIPQIVNYKDLLNNSTVSMSPNDYYTIEINCDYKNFEHFISSYDMGKEVGSFNYLDGTKCKFIRTKCLQDTSILLDLDEAIDINPLTFINFNLLKDDILFVKDSNIGEVCYLFEDLPNCTISGGVVRIKLNNILDKFYIIGIIKSSYFKEQIDLMTPKGSTIRHAKDNFKKARIPIPKDKNIIKKISILTQSLIKKEVEKQVKFSKINKLIEDEIKNNQKNKKFQYSLPSYNNLLISNRLDTGLYTQEYKEIEFLLQNYKHGYYLIDENDLKSGATPKENDRIFDAGDINWITPTNISIYGTIDELPTIAIKDNKYNVKKNCMLFINRTSKGKRGEYVGISMFYDYNKMGKAQHNQGFYRLENKSDTDLLFLTSYMNSKLLRKLCANISLGSKMKEMKSKDFAKIPIPNFLDEKKAQIAKLYYNPNETYLEHIENFNIDEFEAKDESIFDSLGVIDLDIQIKAIKNLIFREIKNLIG